MIDAQKQEIGLTPGPGIYLNVPSARYFAWPYLSKSALSDFAKSPALYYLYATKQMEYKPSASQRIGTASDLMWVEQLDLCAELHTIPRWVNGKRLPDSGKARAAYLESVAAPTISISEADAAIRIADALDQNERACELRAASHAQVSLVWRDEATGLMLKGRPDLVNLINYVLSDLKTTKSIRPHSFDSDCSSYNYHWQLYLYTAGLIANGVGTWADWSQWLITVGNTQPHGVACRPCPAEAIDLARDEVGDLLRRWLHCRTTGVWPADLTDERPINLPKYRFNYTGETDQ